MLKYFIMIAGFIFMLFLTPTIYALPQGSFSQTCKYCKIHHGKLFCMCQEANQLSWRRSSMKAAHRCYYIENLNGRLACTGGYKRSFYKHHRGRHNWGNVNAGPIFSNNQAQSVCPAVCGGLKRWNGQWQTIGSTSYYQCKRRR